MYTRNGKKKSWSVCYCCTMCVECRKDTQRPSRVGELENDGGNNVQQQYHINERLSLLTVLQTYGAINNNTAIARVKAMKKMSGKMAEENQKKEKKNFCSKQLCLRFSVTLCLPFACDPTPENEVKEGRRDERFLIDEHEYEPVPQQFASNRLSSAFAFRLSLATS